MSGKLLVEGRGGWKRTALLILLSAGGTLALILALGRTLLDAAGLEGGLRGAALALAAYALFRVLYGWLGQSLPGAAAYRTVVWELSGGVLTLDGRAVPLSSIRQVHCWPNRDALGHKLPGWTVNLETDGKNELFRSVTEGPGMEISVRQLRALVDALGYGNRWPDND